MTSPADFQECLTADLNLSTTKLDGLMDRAAFYTYIETKFAPILQHFEEVIADDLSSNKSTHAQDWLKAKGSWILFLLLCNSDSYPIEMASSKLKAYLQPVPSETVPKLLQGSRTYCRSNELNFSANKDSAFQSRPNNASGNFAIDRLTAPVSSYKNDLAARVAPFVLGNPMLCWSRATRYH